MELPPGYRETPPLLEQRDVLACLWSQVTPAGGAVATRVLPDGCVDLIWQSGEGAHVAGPDTGPLLVMLSPGTVLIGARFLPGAGGSALGVPLDELRDLRVDIGDLLPALDEQLDGALPVDTAARRVAAAAANLAARSRPDLAVRAAVRRLAGPGGGVPRVDALAAELGLSTRQLLRRCRVAVGYGPKTLQRVLRLRRFLELSRGDDPRRLGLAQLSHLAGYADQAHLSRDCIELAGLSPKALLAHQRGPAVSSTWSGLDCG